MWRGINTDEVGEPNVFAISAHVAAYRSGESLDALRDYVFANKRFASEYISAKMPKLHVVPSDATYLIWVDISAYGNDSAAFCEDLRKKTGLYVSDGARYGKGGEQFLRINLATQRANVTDGLSRLEKYIRELENEKN
jgi:cystathionine beta-lyase